MPSGRVRANKPRAVSANRVLSGITGEWSRVDVTGRSLLAIGYLIVFGSLVAYTAYTWLLAHVAPRIAGTYAFVNPVVAVLLGWWLLGEPLTARTVLATAVIAAGVALIVLAPAPQPSILEECQPSRGAR